ncbi:MAG: hypothetical protein M3376_13175 [Actinomycetota bacterium]|nr:hypothetical protein [Actinomycetota bacterium]
MCFALFMGMLDNTVVNVALPWIQNDLHTSIAGLQWTVNAYTLAFGVLLATGGRLGDSLGQGLLIGAFVAAAGAIVAWRLISPELAGGAVRPPRRSARSARRRSGLIPRETVGA